MENDEIIEGLVKKKLERIGNGRRLSQEEKQEIFIKPFIEKISKSNIINKIFSIDELENKINNGIEHIVVSDELKDGILGDAGAKIVRINSSYYDGKSFEELESDDKFQEIVFHELLHILSSGKKGSGICKVDKHNEYGRGLNEGLTQYFTKLINSAETDNFEFDNVKLISTKFYLFETFGIKQLAIIFGDDMLAELYFRNKDITELVSDSKENQELREALIELRENYDIINKWEYRNKNFEERNNLFIQCQEIFFEKILKCEINRMETVEDAEKLKEKMIKLNSLDIHIKGNEKANCALYNEFFIKKYLKIVNKDKSVDEQEKFNDLYNDLVNGRLIVYKNKKWWEKLITKVKSKIQSKKFYEIQTGNKKIYIKECSEDFIKGKKVCYYKYLTEEEYKIYFKRRTPKDMLGREIKGNLNLVRLKKDKEYYQFVANKVFDEANIDERLLIYDGYIGDVGGVPISISEPLSEYFKTSEKEYVRIKPKGYSRAIYICEEAVSDDLVVYSYLTENDLDIEYLNGYMDLEKLKSNSEYRRYIENHVLCKERLDEIQKNFKWGYFGHVKDFCIKEEPVALDLSACMGANGELKIECKDGEHFYLRKLNLEETRKIPDVDLSSWGLNKYEFIDALEMCKMWEDRNYVSSKDRDHFYMWLSDDDVEKLSNQSESEMKDVTEFYNDIINLGKISDMKNGVLWQHQSRIYYSKNGDFEQRILLPCNIDVERLKCENNKEYKGFIEEYILTQENLVNIESKKILYIEIKEEQEKLEIGEVKYIVKDEKNTSKNNSKEYISH